MLRYLASDYYLNGAAYLFSLYAGWRLCQKRHLHPLLRPFRAYLLLYGIWQIAFLFTIPVSTDRYYKILNNNLNTNFDFLFTLYEYFIFANFLLRSLPYSRRKWINAVSALFCSFSMFFAVREVIRYRQLTLDLVQNLFAGQAAALLALCIIYFAGTGASRHQYTRTPAFWVASGLACFALGTLPLSFFLNFLMSDNSIYQQVFIIYYLFYILLFVSILKAAQIPQGPESEGPGFRQGRNRFQADPRRITDCASE